MSRNSNDDTANLPSEKRHLSVNLDARTIRSAVSQILIEDFAALHYQVGT
jgi:hypothetical protein